jgi:RNA polymerase subunit RPABC4/transcription elongation factor Spt4
MYICKECKTVTNNDKYCPGCMSSNIVALAKEWSKLLKLIITCLGIAIAMFVVFKLFNGYLSLALLN